MTWIMLGLAAGLLLGTYDFFTKLALSTKAVLEVVFLSSIIGALLWLPLFFTPADWAESLGPMGLSPKPLSLAEHLAIVPKSLMMVVTWALSYYSVKALPLSISAGVRASGPIWTAFGAMIFLNELLSWGQWLGIIVATVFYYYFSLIGKREGISLQKNIWVICMLAATILSSANALYDKYILVQLDIDLASVQAYSALQRAAIACLLIPFIIRGLEIRSLLGRNWPIIAIAVFYVGAEFIYLWAVNTEGALISVISILRRTNLVMVFGLSAIFFRENFIGQKSLAIGGVLLGICIVVLS